MTLVDIEAPPTVRMIRKQYAIVPVDGDKPEGWPRATTIAKAIDDSFGLEGHWKAHTLVGAAIKPELAGLAKAAHDAGDTRKARAYADQAFDIAGGNTKRDRGTLVHDYVEKKIADPEWQVPELYRDQVQAIIDGIAARGFRVVVEFSERLVVHDRYKIAGRMDFVLHHEATDTYYVGDLKTGSVRFPLPWAIQLAIYANADAAYDQGAATDGSEDTRTPLPALNRERAVIINAPLDTTDVDFYWLDIATGAELLDLCIQIRDARSLKSKVLTKFEGGGKNATTAQGTAATAQSDVVGTVDDPTTAAALAVLHEARTAWLINRAGNIAKRLSKRHLAEVWPVDIARPAAIKDGDATWTDDDIDTVAKALDALEAKHDVPFGDEDPKVTAQRRAEVEAKIAAEVADEPQAGRHCQECGGTGEVVEGQGHDITLIEAWRCPTCTEPDTTFADPDAVDRVMAVVKAMAASDNEADRERIGRVQAWQRQASNKNVGWKIGGYKRGEVPERLWAIVAAAVGYLDLIDLDATDPDRRVRDLLAAVHDDDIAQQPTASVGALFGLLTTDQALRLAEMAEAVTNNNNTDKDNQQ